MFTPGDRDRVRAELISAARSDEAIAGAALTGSAAVDGEDRWSDIDLALGLAEGADSALVIARWTERMYVDHDAIHHLDIVSGATVCRVFMLASTLQVDISFAPAAEFGAVAPAFRLLFGTAVSREPRPEPAARPGLVGQADGQLAARLAATLRELARTDDREVRL
jgi:predicted nucleotidyltransferase